jgi:arylsulfatase A
VKLDSHSFAPQIEGKKGSPREWVYVELNGKSYVRDKKYKLTARGDMFDLSQAPFKEIPVTPDAKDSEANAARKTLQAVLDDHKALPGKVLDTPKQKKAKQAKRAQRRKAAEKAT